MRIWFIKTGEPWPTDGDYPRLLRTGVMAQMYARRGDEVVWFNGTFDHFAKKHRHDADIVLPIEPNLTLVGLHSPGYARNVSLRRIRDHRLCASAFSRQARRLALPDVIVAAMPTLELAREAIRFGRRHAIPVIVDVRDLWPDIWSDMAPPLLRPLARIALGGFHKMLREIVDGSSAICGISQSAVDWALAHGTRPRNRFDEELPLAYEPPVLSAPARETADRYWDSLGLDRGKGRFILCFFGSLSARIDIGTVIEAARQIEGQWRDRIRIVMCGAGQWGDRLALAARETPVLCFPGWVDGAQVSRLVARADVGILPYFNTRDFVVSYPNKVFDYLGGGLPILTSLGGITGKLIAENGCGWHYGEGQGAALAGKLVELAQQPQAVAVAAGRAHELGQKLSASVVYGGFRDRLAAIMYKGGPRLGDKLSQQTP